MPNGELTKEILERLLSWINPDRAQALIEYDQIRAGLVEKFTSDGCGMPDALADETFIRVAQAPPNVSPGSADHRLIIFEKAARKVSREYFKSYASTQEAFDNLLNWLDPDENKAAEKYRQIHSKLTTTFRARGCEDPESLADVTINRVMKKLPKIQRTYTGNPALYFSGVARKILKEYFRSYEFTRRVFGDTIQERQLPGQYTFSEQEDESPERRCLIKCLDKCKSKDREMMLEYFQKDKRDKIKQREEMSKKLGITPTNLRVRIHRVLTAIHKCMDECLGVKGSK